MDSSFIERFMSEDGLEADAAPDAPSPAFIDYYLKGSIRKALPYEHIIWVDLAHGSTIIVHYSTHTVTLTGRKLNGLYSDILARKVSKVEVIDERYADNDSSDPVVTEIVALQHTAAMTGAGFGPDQSTGS